MPTLPKTKPPSYIPKRKKWKNRRSDKYKFINSQDWRKKSRHYSMSPENVLCVVCGAAGANTDHIIPRPEGSLWDDRNLQRLCLSCHGRKSQMEKSGPLVAWTYNERGEKIPLNKTEIIEILRQ